MKTKKQLASLLPRKLWTVAYRAACKADPDRFRGTQTWKDEKKHHGRLAGWDAVARYMMNRGFK